MSQAITKAFVLAAGQGTRMRPMTDNCPKPLIALNGVPMIDRNLAKLRAVGVTDIVVNTHYKAEQIAEHLKGQSDITISHEPDLLDTGGGLRFAAPHFKDEPFYVVTSDIMWTDGEENTLQRLAKYWHSKPMDLLLLLNEKLPEAKGDFYMEGQQGQPIYRNDTTMPPNKTYMGVSVVHPRLLKSFELVAFPFRDLIFKAQKDERLFGMVHTGERFSVGTPENFQKFEAVFKARGL